MMMWMRVYNNWLVNNYWFMYNDFLEYDLRLMNHYRFMHHHSFGHHYRLVNHHWLMDHNGMMMTRSCFCHCNQSNQKNSQQFNGYQRHRVRCNIFIIELLRSKKTEDRLMMISKICKSFIQKFTSYSFKLAI